MTTDGTPLSGYSYAALTARLERLDRAIPGDCHARAGIAAAKAEIADEITLREERVAISASDLGMTPDALLAQRDAEQARHA